MSTNDTFLAVFTGGKNSAKMAAWNALAEGERNARQQQGIAAWRGWVEKHQGAILQMGGPLGKTKKVDSVGVARPRMRRLRRCSKIIRIFRSFRARPSRSCRFSRFRAVKLRRSWLERPFREVLHLPLVGAPKPALEAGEREFVENAA